MKKFSCKSVLALAGITVALSTISRVQATSHVVMEGIPCSLLRSNMGLIPTNWLK